MRLRTTFQDGEKGEGLLYRVARKLEIGGSRAKVEKQIKFPPHDPDAKDFAYLWKRYIKKSEVISKTRYYIHHQLPNGNMCEIHYDIHHGKFGGFVRIEVEFKGTTADSDHQYVLDNGSETCFSDWVGVDVSDDKRYGGKMLAKLGVPEGILEEQEGKKLNKK